MSGEEVNEYELQRQKRIEENRRRMEELGLLQSAADFNATANPNPAPAKRVKREKKFHIEVEVRRSGRLQGTGPEAGLYSEDDTFDKLGLGMMPAHRHRLNINMDPEVLRKLQEERMAQLGLPEGTHNSGLGVRVQGGRLYDSQFGTTCHWCRQKTLEPKATCANEDCGGGGKLPAAFCRMCLTNRHGEDIDQAIASGCWFCPACRGSCGRGCVTCCNCGPCRKRAGLAPTHQLIKEARAAGFSNCHDFLVYRSTKETPEEIAARKTQHDWGKWFTLPYEPKKEEEEEAEAEEEQAEQEQAGGDISISPSKKMSPAKSPAKTASPSKKLEPPQSPAKTGSPSKKLESPTARRARMKAKLGLA